MRNLSFALTIGLLMAACTPMAASDMPAPGQSQTADASACAARGGRMQPVGRMQSMQCVVAYADAGKTCADGDQCEGDCRIDGNNGLNAGAAATGQCQATSDGFGCFTRVEDGKATGTLCVD